MSNKSRAGFNSRLLALTLARRAMKRNLLQSILIILVIALPVAAGAFGLTYDASTKATAVEKIRYELGSTQGRLHADTYPDAKNFQIPEDGNSFYFDASGEAPDSTPENPQLIDPREELAGYTWLPERVSSTNVKTATGMGLITLVEGQAWAPEFEGRYYAITGAEPTNDDQIMVNRQALIRLGVELGEKVTFLDSQKSLTVVGTLESATTPSNVSIIYARPTAVSGVEINQQEYNFYAVGAKPIQWSQVDALNKKGIGVLSRDVLQNPPASSDVPLYSAGWIDSNSFGSTLSNILSVIFLVPLVLLPVAVLAGSAFSFGARRQAKSLAVISSLGANASLLRFITVANGIWLGLLGGILGVVVGAVAAFFAMPMLTNGSKTGFPGFHLPLAFLAGVGLSGAVIGAIVSLIPAFTAAKVDVLSTLRGIRSSAKLKKRAGAGSLIVIAIGAIISIVSVIAVQSLYVAINAKTIDIATSNQLLAVFLFTIAIGSAVVILGLLIGSSWLLVLARVLFRRLGTAANYATNDLIYNRKRYTAVIASVLATSFVGATVLTFFFSFAEYGRESYKPFGEVNQLIVDAKVTNNYNVYQMSDLAEIEKVFSGKESKVAAAISSAKSVADTSSEAVLNMHRQYRRLFPNLGIGVEGQQPYLVPNPDLLCPYMPGSSMYDEFQRLQDEQDYAELNKIVNSPELVDCQRLVNSVSEFVVGTPKELRALLGNRVDKVAEESLAAGNAVAFSPGFIENGKVSIKWFASGMDESVFGNAPYDANGMPILDASGKPIKLGDPTRVEELPAVVSKTSNPDVSMMISPETADKLGISYEPWIALVNFAKPITTAEYDTLSANFATGFTLERGYSVDVQAIAWMITAAVAFLVLASTSIALGLAQIESRADQSTLGSLGAPKRFRASILGSQALILTAFGTTLGGAVGIFLAWAITKSASFAIGTQIFNVPIQQLAVIIAGIPLTAGLIFWLGTPARSSYRQRLSID